MINQSIIQRETRQVKPDGVTYEVIDLFPNRILGISIIKGFRFSQCNDGWYQVFNSEGKKLHYRLHKEVIATNIAYLKEVKKST